MSCQYSFILFGFNNLLTHHKFVFSVDVSRYCLPNFTKKFLDEQTCIYIDFVCFTILGITI